MRAALTALALVIATTGAAEAKRRREPKVYTTYQTEKREREAAERVAPPNDPSTNSGAQGRINATVDENAQDQLPRVWRSRSGF